MDDKSREAIASTADKLLAVLIDSGLTRNQIYKAMRQVQVRMMDAESALTLAQIPGLGR